MGYMIDSDILLNLIHNELITSFSSLNIMIPDGNKRRHFEMAIGGIIKRAGELTATMPYSRTRENDKALSDAVQMTLSDLFPAPRRHKIKNTPPGCLLDECAEDIRLFCVGCPFYSSEEDEE